MPTTDLQTPDPLAMNDELDTLAKLASSQEFLGLVKDIRDASESDRPAVAKQLATISELAKRGVQVPPEMRLTLRYFEERPDKTVTAVVTDTNVLPAGPQLGSSPTGPVATSPSPPPPLVAGGWTVCATTGASTGGVISCASIGKLV
jgi:hypothetical protein